jgi:hypothetical protein
MVRRRGKPSAFSLTAGKSSTDIPRLENIRDAIAV